MRHYFTLFALLLTFGIHLTAHAQTPSAPTGVTIHGSTASMTLTWSAVTNAASYKIYRGTSSNGESTTAVASGITATTYTDSSLTNGTRYYYKITAVGSGGAESAQSSEVTEVPVGQCTSVTTHAGNTQVTLSWTFPAGAVSFRVFRGTTSGGEAATPIAIGLTGSSYTDTGLTNNTTYYYQVTAARGDSANPGSESTRSSEVSAMPTPPPPLAPTGVNAIAGSSQVVLSWNASATATSYTVKRGTIPGSYGTVTTQSGLTYTNTGLTNGTTYYYVVTASNAGGESANSTEVSVTPAASGGGANGLPAIADAVVMQFNPTINYGTIGNVYTRSDANNLKYTFLKFDLSGASGSITNATLKLIGSASVAGTDTAWGVSDTSWSETGVTWNTKPTLTQSLSSTSIGTTLQTYSWDVTSWVQAKQAAGTNVISLGVSMTSTATNASSTYWSREAGYGNRPVLFVTVGGPIAPHLTANGGLRQISLSWTASSGATSYNVKRSATTGGTYTTLNGGAPVTGTSFVDTPLGDGATYYYVVSANNVNGAGPNSNEASATTTAAVPNPTGLRAVASTQRVYLNWDTGGSSIRSYGIYRSTIAGGPYTKIATAHPTEYDPTNSSYIDTHLTNTVTYYYVITANTVDQESGYSNEASATPQAPPTTSISCEQTITGSIDATDPIGVAGPTSHSDYYSFSAIAGQTVTITMTASDYLITTLDLYDSTGEEVDSGFGIASPAQIHFYIPTTGTYTVEAETPGATESEAYTITLNCTNTPPTPLNLRATPLDSQVHLDWDTTVYGLTYLVKRALVSGGPYTIIGTSSSGQYTDLPLTNYTKYYYVVTGTSTLGESANSNEVNATPRAYLAIDTLTIDPTSITGGLTATGTVTLVTPAPIGGVTIGLSSNNAVASIRSPATVIVAEGQTSATFQIATTYTSAATTATITGTLNGNMTATLTVTPPTVSGIVLNPASVVEGDPSTGTLTLSGSAPSGGLVIPLSVTHATVPANVTVAAGATTASFAITTDATVTATSATVTATLNGAQSATLTLKSPWTPRGLSATPGTAQVALVWTASHNAVSYKVYRGTASGAESSTPIASGLTSPSYTDASPPSGSVYYKVSAVNGAGESALCAEVTTSMGAAAPTGLTASAADSKVYLHWNRQSSAVTYNLYRSISTGNEVLVFSGITQNNYTDANLTNGTAYFYKVTAVNGSGETNKSNEASDTPQPLMYCP